jgi:radical SAM superfamily enzyme YgiQ (UPF0313 family)
MFVGIWATLNAEALLRRGGVDLVGRGEVDDTVADVCDALESGRPVADVANVWSLDEQGAIRRSGLRPLVQDLDGLPMPARDLLPVARHANERDGILTVLASRGCPMKCSFCTHVVMRDAYDVRPASYMRYKSVDRVFAEIRAARALMPQIWGIYFHDDIFFLQPQWKREFLARYPREIGLPFGCNLVIGQARDELLAELAAAGCDHLLIGVESGSEERRRKIMDKPLDDAEIEAVASRCRRHGIRAKYYALIGAPDETRAELVKSLKGFARYGSDMVQVQAWLAHETSALLEKDPAAAAISRRMYETGAGDRGVRRLKFYFHHYQRYVALYRLLARETRWPRRRRLIRALVTLSVRLPCAPELLAGHGWDGRARWPLRLRGFGLLALRALGAPGRWLLDEVPVLERRLAADYLKPAGLVRLPDEADTGWTGDSRLDRRRTALGA